MSRRNGIGLWLLVLTLCVVVPGSLYLSAQEKESVKPKAVNAADIPKSVKIIGRLGKPMTEVIEIEGHWFVPHDGGKPANPEFVVTSVADKELEQPVVIYGRVDFGDSGPMDIKVGETWKCKAIELGRFANVVPNNWVSDFVVSTPALGGQQFVSELVIARKSLVRTAQK